MLNLLKVEDYAAEDEVKAEKILQKKNK